MTKLSSGAKSWVLITIFAVILLLVILFCEDARPDQIDTLELQLQWAYPISVTDMRLVDFDGDGASEILVGFHSDTSHVGIIDVPNQAMIWHGPRLHGEVFTVASGDRNSDGCPDVIIGGRINYPWGDQGFFQIYDGPAFDSALAFAGIDHAVTAVEICHLGHSDRSVVIGTDWGWTDNIPDENWHQEGHLYLYNAADVSLRDSAPTYTVMELAVRDLNQDGGNELVSGEQGVYDYFGAGPDHESVWLCTRASYPESTRVFTLFYAFAYCPYDPRWFLHFGALALSDFDEDGNTEILVGHRACSTEGWFSGGTQLSCWARLECLDATTGEKKWEEIDSVSGDHVTGLAVCGLSQKSTEAVCAAYHSGLIKLKAGVDGTDLAISDSLPLINHFALGNVDQDNLTELCIASDESLYVYETPSITTDVEETEHPSRPGDFCLFQNYPNPFNPETTIRFTVPERTDIRLEIFNILGERVRSLGRHCMPGTHTIIWDGKNSHGEEASSGVYLYRLTAGDIKETRKMVLLR